MGVGESLALSATVAIQVTARRGATRDWTRRLLAPGSVLGQMSDGPRRRLVIAPAIVPAFFIVNLDWEWPAPESGKTQELVHRSTLANQDDPTTRNQINGGKLAMIAGPQPTGL